LQERVTAGRRDAQAGAGVGVVHVGVIALFHALDRTIATALVQTRGAAAISIDQVAVVAALDASLYEQVAADRLEARARTGVGVVQVVVVALFVGVDDPVAADAVAIAVAVAITIAITVTGITVAIAIAIAITITGIAITVTGIAITVATAKCLGRGAEAGPDGRGVIGTSESQREWE
jgi:hypothetical protein